MNDQQNSAYSFMRTCVEKFINPTEHEWDAFFEKTKIVSLTKGDVYIEEGEVCRKLAFVASGAMRMYYFLHGEEHCKDFQFESQFTGSFYSALTKQPSRFSVAALENSILIEISADTLFTLYDDYKVWERFGRIYMQQAFIYKEKREASLLFDTSTERYEKLMREQPDHIKRIPLKYLASYLGIKPESLSRIRKRLSKSIS